MNSSELAGRVFTCHQNCSTLTSLTFLFLARRSNLRDGRGERIAKAHITFAINLAHHQCIIELITIHFDPHVQHAASGPAGLRVVQSCLRAILQATSAHGMKAYINLTLHCVTTSSIKSGYKARAHIQTGRKYCLRNRTHFRATIHCARNHVEDWTSSRCVMRHA